jgi:hypothetical protein
MCNFCEGKETVERNYKIQENKELTAYLRIDEDRNNKFYLLRNEQGEVGYTLPIIANFCMFCGKKLNV